MNNFHGDTVFAMPPLSMRCVEKLAEAVLRYFQPSALDAPEAANLVDWIDRLLPPFGVHVMPASEEELGGCAAATYPTAEYESEILIPEWIWNDLAHDPKPNFARTTVMHEIAHVILHVPVIRQLSNAVERDFALARVERSSVPAFCDPEWQAWALAGAVLIPRRTVAMLADPSPATVADTYQVSAKFAAIRLRRLAQNNSRAASEVQMPAEEG